jgi:positive regulator of sigma E activity
LPSQPEKEAGQSQELVITLATGLISLVVVAYLVVRRYRRQDADEEDVEPEEQGGQEE